MSSTIKMIQMASLLVLVLVGEFVNWTISAYFPPKRPIGSPKIRWDDNKLT